jgi:hypothetical protein
MVQANTSGLGKIVHQRGRPRTDLTPTGGEWGDSRVALQRTAKAYDAHLVQNNLHRYPGSLKLVPMNFPELVPEVSGARTNVCIVSTVMQFQYDVGVRL